MAFEDLILRVAKSADLDRMLKEIHRHFAFVIEFDDFRQEILLRAWNARERFVGDEENALLGYLWSVSRHFLVDELRRKSSKIPTTGDEVIEFVSARRNEASVESKDFVRWLVADLNVDERDVVRERYWAGKSLAEIARSSGKTYRAVVQLHYRAIRKLKAVLPRRETSHSPLVED